MSKAQEAIAGLLRIGGSPYVHGEEDGEAAAGEAIKTAIAALEAQEAALQEPLPRIANALERIADALSPGDQEFSWSVFDHLSDISNALCGEIDGGICDAIRERK